MYLWGSLRQDQQLYLLNYVEKHMKQEKEDDTVLCSRNTFQLPAQKGKASTCPT